MDQLLCVPGVGGCGCLHASPPSARTTGLVARALDENTRRGERVLLGELARWHAAARARTVLVRRSDGSLLRYDRSDEPAASVAARLADPAAAARARIAQSGGGEKAGTTDTLPPVGH